MEKADQCYKKYHNFPKDKQFSIKPGKIMHNWSIQHQIIFGKHVFDLNNSFYRSKSNFSSSFQPIFKNCLPILLKSLLRTKNTMLKMTDSVSLTLLDWEKVFKARESDHQKNCIGSDGCWCPKLLNYQNIHTILKGTCIPEDLYIFLKDMNSI